MNYPYVYKEESDIEIHFNLYTYSSNGKVINNFEIIKFEKVKDAHYISKWELNITDCDTSYVSDEFKKEFSSNFINYLQKFAKNIIFV